MKAYRKAGMYSEAYQDAKTIWDLMSDYERAKNYSFRQQNIIELQILSRAQVGTNNMHPVQNKERHSNMKNMNSSVDKDEQSVGTNDKT